MNEKATLDAKIQELSNEIKQFLIEKASHIVPFPEQEYAKKRSPGERIHAVKGPGIFIDRKEEMQFGAHNENYIILLPDGLYSLHSLVYLDPEFSSHSLHVIKLLPAIDSKQENPILYITYFQRAYELIEKELQK